MTEKISFEFLLVCFNRKSLVKPPDCIWFDSIKFGGGARVCEVCVCLRMCVAVCEEVVVGGCRVTATMGCFHNH